MRYFIPATALSLLLGGAAYGQNSPKNSCEDVSIDLKFECEQSVRQHDSDKQAIKLACRQLKFEYVQNGGCKIGPDVDAEDCARMKASLKQCALDFPGF
jgi:hypothetical protein